jgi:hypothetical protein
MNPLPYSGEGILLRDLTVQAIDRMVDCVRRIIAPPRRGSPSRWARPRCGLPSTAALDAIDQPFVCFTFGLAPDAAALAAVDRHVKVLLEGLGPWDSGRRYLNCAESSMDPRSIFPVESYERLARAKARYDPTESVPGQSPGLAARTGRPAIFALLARYAPHPERTIVSADPCHNRRPACGLRLIGAGRIGRLHARILTSLPGVDGSSSPTPCRPPRSPSRTRSAGSSRESAEEAMAGGGCGRDRGGDRCPCRLASARHRPAQAELHREATRLRPRPGPASSSTSPSRAGVPVQLGFQRRFDAGYVEARRMVAAGEMGVIYIIRLIAHDDAPPPEAYIPTSGGLFRDSSIHDFDALRFITGQEVEDVYAVGAVRGFEMFAKYGDIDTGAAILRLTDGTNRDAHADA